MSLFVSYVFGDVLTWKQLDDATAKGNTCDTENDEPGCIFSETLLVLDATEEEISSAVAGITPGIKATGAISATDIKFAGLSVAVVTGAVSVGAAEAVTTDAAEAACGAATPAPAKACSVVTTTVASEQASSILATVTAATTIAASGSGTNVQTFTGTLGGPAPPVVSSAGSRPFSVNGNTFVNSGAALQRSCAIQHNACADAANSGKLSGGVGQCETQEDACNAAGGSKAKLRRRAADFGSCSNPGILFGPGLDGRNTEAFIAADQDQFPHGSALNIGVIAGFICQHLASPCSADAAAQAVCTSASAAAAKVTPQNQQAADAFNSVLGVADGGQGAAAPAAPATVAAGSVVVTYTTCI